MKLRWSDKRTRQYEGSAYQIANERRHEEAEARQAKRDQDADVPDCVLEADRIECDDKINDHIARGWATPMRR